MNAYLKFGALGVLAVMLASATACTQLEARDQLNRGVNAFKSADFNEAIAHFQDAIQLDPTLVNAKIYLATAYQSQFIPGAPSPDNMEMAQNALSAYQRVLDQDPNNPNALTGIALLNYDMGNLDTASQYYQKELAVSPNDSTAYYTLGAIAYQKTDKGILAARTSLGETDRDTPMVPAKKAPANAKKDCQQLNQQDEATIDDGITQLNKALELRPNYSDAMTYLNLLYRDKADLTCGNQADFTSDTDIANDFANKALAERKAAVAASNKNNSGGVVMDTSSQ